MCSLCVVLKQLARSVDNLEKFPRAGYDVLSSVGTNFMVLTSLIGG